MRSSGISCESPCFNRILSVEVVCLRHLLEAEQLRHLADDLRILAVEVERDPAEPVELGILVEKTLAPAPIDFERLLKGRERRGRIVLFGERNDPFERVRPSASPGFRQNRPGIPVHEKLFLKEEPVVHGRTGFRAFEGSEEDLYAFVPPEFLHVSVRPTAPQVLVQAVQEIIGQQGCEGTIGFLFDRQSDHHNPELLSQSEEHLLADTLPVRERLLRLTGLCGVNSEQERKDGEPHVCSAEGFLSALFKPIGGVATALVCQIQHVFGRNGLQQQPEAASGEIVSLFPMEIRARIQILHPTVVDSFPKDLERAGPCNAEIVEQKLQVARGMFSASEETYGEKREHLLSGRRLGSGRLSAVEGSGHVELQ